jgi:hypothetical protein
MSAQSTSSTSSSSTSSQYLPSFQFDIPSTSAFDKDSNDISMEFDSALGFKDVSPQLVPTGLPKEPP